MGSCPIVVAGLEDARKPFDSNPQLAHRTEAHIDLHKLDAAVSADRELFWTFLSEYLLKAESLGAANNLLDLVRGDTPACILEVSQGVLGAACNLIKDVVHAACLRGSMNVKRVDLETATDNSIRKKLYTRNPFREGLGPLRRNAE